MGKQRTKSKSKGRKTKRKRTPINKASQARRGGKGKGKSKPAPLTTRGALARAVGVVPSTITKLLAREDCPIGTKGPWGPRDVAKLVAYRGTLQENRAAFLQTGRGPSGEEAAGLRAGSRVAADVMLKMERVKKLRRERLVLEGEYISREEVVAGWEARARYFKETGYAMIRGVSPTVAAEDDPATCEQILLKKWDALLDGYTRSPLPGLDGQVA